MSKESLRDKFAPTKLATIQEQVSHDDSYGYNGGSDRIKLDDGTNKIRYMPAHPDSKMKGFYIMKGEHWCSYWNEEEGEEKRRPFLNARIHAKVDMDLFEEYIGYAKNFLLGAKSTDDKKKKWELIVGRDGLKLSTFWQAYVLKISKSAREFGLFDIKKSVRNAMNSEALIEDPEESTDIEPFTHPDTGKPVLITYDSKAKKAADYYKVKMATRADQLTDAELEKLMAAKPLDELCFYTKADFDRSLEALEYFDESNDIGIFEEDGFQTILENIKLQFEELEDAPAPSKATAKSSAKSAPAKPSGKVDFAAKAAASKAASKPAKSKYGDMEEEELLDLVVERELATPKKAKLMDAEELTALLVEDDAESAGGADAAEDNAADAPYDDMEEDELIDLCVERELATVKSAKKLSKEELIELLTEDDGENKGGDAEVEATEPTYDDMSDEELVDLAVERELATPKSAGKLSREDIIDLLNEDDAEATPQPIKTAPKSAPAKSAPAKPAAAVAKKSGISLEDVKARLKKGGA